MIESTELSALRGRLPSPEPDIIDHLVLRLLVEDGARLSVEDEEESVVAAANDANDILAGIGHSGYSTLRLGVNGGYVGMVLLVHGNEADVISDYSAALESRMKPVLEYIEARWGRPA